MTSFIHADIFFFISSVGFVVLFVLLAIVLFYAIRAFKSWERMLGKLEQNVGNMSDTAKDMLADVHDSNVFRFIFGKKKRPAKK